MRYIKISLKSPNILPHKFLGSTIRGAFGVGLKDVVCINPTKKCEGCFAISDCAFYDFYEKKSPKYRLKIDLRGKLDFDMYLFEEFIDFAPYVISAIHKTFTEIGITNKRLKPPFKLYLNDKLIFDEKFLDFNIEALEIKEVEYNHEAKLFIKTPIRVKENNRFVRDNIKLETILRSIHHRVLTLTNQPLSKLPFTPLYKIKSQNFIYQDFTRYSNRQKTSMNFGGLMGMIEFEFIDEESFKLLKIGEVVGVGKQVTFGMGEIEVK